MEALNVLPGDSNGLVTVEAVYDWLYENKHDLDPTPQRHSKGEGKFVLAHTKAADVGTSKPTTDQFDACYHPPLTLDKRTPLPPGPKKFWIHAQWLNIHDKNWTEYGDVRVELEGVTERAYLLPSGATPPSVHNPKNWGENGREHKKKLTKAWCLAKLNVWLDGFLFDMESRKGGLVPRVYCPSYDAFLRGQAATE